MFVFVSHKFFEGIKKLMNDNEKNWFFM